MVILDRVVGQTGVEMGSVESVVEGRGSIKLFNALVDPTKFVEDDPPISIQSGVGVVQAYSLIQTLHRFIQLSELSQRERTELKRSEITGV